MGALFDCRTVNELLSMIEHHKRRRKTKETTWFIFDPLGGDRNMNLRPISCKDDLSFDVIPIAEQNTMGTNFLHVTFRISVLVPVENLLHELLLV